MNMAFFKYLGYTNCYSLPDKMNTIIITYATWKYKKTRDIH